MFRKIRKVKNEIPLQDAKNLLKLCKRGVISFSGENDYPYSIPINFYYNEADNKIYFHGAKKGYKVDCIEKNNKASFVVYGDEKLSEDGWSYYVSSTIVFGKIEIIKERDLLLKKIKEFALKYYPSAQEVDHEIAEGIDYVLFFSLNIEHISGKRVREK